MNITSSVDSAEEERMVLRLQNFVHIMDLYYTPTVISFGIVANTFLLCVAFKTKLRHVSISVYIIAIAMVDCVFLLSYIPFWLHAVHKMTAVCLPVVCQLSTYLHAISQFIFAWLAVLLQFHTCAAIAYPRVMHLPARKHLHLVAVLLMMAFFFYLFLFVTTGKSSELSVDIIADNWLYPKIRNISAEEQVCSCTFTTWKVILRIFARAELILSTVIPYSILIVLLLLSVSMLLSKMYQVNQERKTTREENEKECALKRKQFVGISVSFLCLMTIIWIQVMLKEASQFGMLLIAKPYKTQRQLLHQRVRYYVYISSFSIKLLLYIIFWSDMRKAMLECVYCETRSKPTEQNDRLVECTENDGGAGQTQDCSVL